MKSYSAIQRKFFLAVSLMAIIMVVAFYKFKLVHTLGLYNESANAELLAMSTESSSEKLAGLKASLSSIEKRTDDKRSKEQLQQELLNFFAQLGSNNKLEVTAISDAVVSVMENYLVTNFSIELSGVYTELVKALNDFENNAQGMRLASVKFQSFDNRQTKRKQLKAVLHVQHLRLKKV